MTLDLPTLNETVRGTASAFRCVIDYQPAGGPGDKVFPPTYEGGKYATEERIDPATGEIRRCVLLDSVPSQANRMELALLEAHRAGHIELPLLVARFDQHELLKKFTVTSLEAPHRAADALFRDSRLGGVMFRKSEKGKVLDAAEVRNATGLFGLCPTALVFGLWDSTGPRGGLGAKFQRAVVSEIVGYGAVPGKNTASRIDPAEIRIDAGTLYQRESSGDDVPDWTLHETSAKHDKSEPVPLGKGSKRGKPSQANHGNVTPDYAYVRDQNGQIAYDIMTDQDGRSILDAEGNQVRKPRILGGFTISKATQTTVLSLSALRRLRFPLNGSTDSSPEADAAARTVLAALGLAAGTLARSDTDLRSRCQLFAEQAPVWELLDRPGQAPQEFTLGADEALGLLGEAVAKAKDCGLPWEGEIELTPSSELVELIQRSQELASNSGAQD